MSAVNSARSTKWYSRPSSSLFRGLRVVCETLNRIPSKRALRAEVSVVLPAPDGEDTMRSSGELFDILDLFAQSLELCFEFHDEMRERGIRALGANRVCFSPYFLQEELQTSPHRFPTLA